MDRKINPWSIDIDDESKEFALTSAALGSKMWSEPGFGVRVDDIMGWAYSDGGMTPDGSFRVVPLSRMLSEQSEGDVQRCLNTFRADSALSFDVKLRKDAIGFERSDRCRTYLIMTPSDDILGYLMLGLGNLNVPEGNCLSMRVLRKLGLDKGHGTVPTFVLAQLSWAIDSPDGFENVLLTLAHNLLMESSRVVGCNIVVTECGEEQVEALEEKGFHMLCRDGDLSRFVLARV